VFPQPPNCAVGRGGPCNSAFYHLHLDRLKLFRDPEKEIVLGAANRNLFDGVIWLALHRREVVQCKRGNVSVMKEGGYAASDPEGASDGIHGLGDRRHGNSFIRLSRRHSAGNDL